MVDGVLEGKTDGILDGLVEWTPEGPLEGIIDGYVDGNSDGKWDGSKEGCGTESDGFCDIDGKWEILGMVDGELDGMLDGVVEGTVDGKLDGFDEGKFDGRLDGLVDGIMDMLGTCETAIVGDEEGIALGRYNSVGLCDGDIDEVGAEVSDMMKLVSSVLTKLDADFITSLSILSPYHPSKILPLPNRS